MGKQWNKIFLPLEDKLWTQVVETEDGCLEWTRSTNEHGYGWIYDPDWHTKRKLRKTHQVAWEVAFGPVPEGLWVLHHCDNPPCCNPNHLFLGDCQGNVDDMVAKNRQGSAKGLNNANAKLTRSQVDTILNSYVQQYTVNIQNKWRSNAKELSEEFGVTKQYIGQLLKGQWRKEQ